VTQSDEFDETFGCEDGDKDDVDVVEDQLNISRSLVVLDSHCEHVEKDDEHNKDVELLISRYFEHG